MKTIKPGGALKHNPFASLAKHKAIPAAGATGSVTCTTECEGSGMALQQDRPPRTAAARFPRPLTLRQETKGRHGKTVTRVLGLPAAELGTLAPELQKALGCGALVDGEDLLLLGAVEARATSYLRKAGAKRVLSNGEQRMKPAETAPALGARATRQVDRPRAAGTKSPERAEASAPAPRHFVTPGGKRQGNQRHELHRGQRVAIVLKADQNTGKLTVGLIDALLTNSGTHPHGIKVRLESGQVGRVKQLLDD